jgi:hypothetical protein
MAAVLSAMMATIDSILLVAGSRLKTYMPVSERALRRGPGCPENTLNSGSFAGGRQSRPRWT